MSDSTTADVFVLVDPVLDYDESMSILGVYVSLHEAQAAVPALLERWTHYLSRLQHVEHWQGDKCRARWEYRPIDGSWKCIEIDGISR